MHESDFYSLTGIDNILASKTEIENEYKHSQTLLSCLYGNS